MEVESTVSGTLVEIVVPSGTVEVGEPIGWVEGEDTGGGFGDLLSETPSEPRRPSPSPRPRPRPGPSRPRPRPATAIEASTTVLPVEPARRPGRRPRAPAASGPVAAVPRARALRRARDRPGDGHRQWSRRPDPGRRRGGPGPGPAAPAPARPRTGARPPRPPRLPPPRWRPRAPLRPRARHPPATARPRSGGPWPAR